MKPHVHRGPFGPGPYVEAVALRPDVTPTWGEFPFLAPVGCLDALELAPGVNFLAGENGTGKSTLLEANGAHSSSGNTVLN
jgi:predicted ATPase